jgi:chromate reductase
MAPFLPRQIAIEPAHEVRDMGVTRDVAVLVGSLRKGSYSKMVARALIGLAPQSLSLEIVEIGQLSLYNQDLETEHPPEEWTEFRERIRRADAVLFVTPEYNRSVPGALKNAIDVGSRPPGKSAWQGKPGAVVSNAPGSYGGFGANHALRQSMVFLNVPMMQMPEAYLAHIADAVDPEGNLINDKTRGLLQRFIDAYAAWVELILGGKTST